MTRAAQVRGWCPGAYRPMQSGDGLILRVRPCHARLDRRQILGLCTLALTYGNGFLDLTNRANLQIRGVSDGDVAALLDGLTDLDLLDATPEIEARRNILVAPFWRPGDDTHMLSRSLVDALETLPALPAKFGYAIDLQGLLQDASADIRVEHSDQGIMVRADGAVRGRPVTRDTAIAAIREMAQWFTERRKGDDRRMAHLVAHTPPPEDWQTATPVSGRPTPVPGPHAQGLLIGAAFGQIDTRDLAQLVKESHTSAMRVTPWRLLLLEGAKAVSTDRFITTPEDPLLMVDACPGAPHCDRASVATRDLARRLAAVATGTLHVSGCAKGCARKARADRVFVGNTGHFDLVLDGHAWDAPEKSGLRPDETAAEMTNHP